MANPAQLPSQIDINQIAAAIAAANAAATRIDREASAAAARAEREAMIAAFATASRTGHEEAMTDFATALRNALSNEGGATRGSLSAKVTRTYDADIPKLEGKNITPQMMAEWLARFTAWAKIEGISEYTLGPAPPAPTSVKELQTHKSNLQEGLKYICAAIADPDLKQSLAKRAGNSGVHAMEILKADFMGGQQVQPILRQMLRDMRLQAEQSPQVFKNNWLSRVDDLDPKPSAAELYDNFVFSINAETEGMYESCISGVGILLGKPTDDYNDSTSSTSTSWPRTCKIR